MLMSTMIRRVSATMSKMMFSAIAIIAALAIGQSAQAQSTMFSFGNISYNSPQNAGTADQFSLEVTTTSLVDGDLGPSQVAFIFRNDGPADSAITRIYFEENDLLGDAEVNNLNGWSNFGQGGAPLNPPGGNGLETPFATSVNFTSSGNPQNGVNPGEAVEIVFDLAPGMTYIDLIAAIEQGMTDPDSSSLRIAMHVQAFDNGGSESFIVTVPLPAPIWMGLAGLAGIVVLRRRALH